MTSREQFEAWCKVNTERNKWHPEYYAHLPAQEQWAAWQASREAVAVDLPDKQFISEDEALIPEDSDWPDGFNTALEQCAEAIRAAGIKVKGGVIFANRHG